MFGTNNRKTAETAMNKDSSRSHSIFTIFIETSQIVNEEQRIKAGKLNLVDLAVIILTYKFLMNRVQKEQVRLVQQDKP